MPIEQSKLALFGAFLFLALSGAGQVFVVHPGFAAKTVKEFIAAAHAQPGRINYGSGGSGAFPGSTRNPFLSAFERRHGFGRTPE